MLRACPTALQTTHTNLASRPSAPSLPSPPPLRQRGSGGDVCTQGAAAASSTPFPSCPAATAVAVGADHRGASRARLRRCRAAPLAAAAVRPRARQGPCALASGPRAALATARTAVAAALHIPGLHTQHAARAREHEPRSCRATPSRSCRWDGAQWRPAPGLEQKRSRRRRGRRDARGTAAAPGAGDGRAVRPCARYQAAACPQKAPHRS